MPFDIKPGRGSDRVKAWVYAILNPLIDSVRRETELLKTGDLSWRIRMRQCEYIRRVADFIDFNQRPNLDDFLAENPTFSERFAEHDSGVMEIEQTTAQFVRDLLRSPDFQDRVAKCLRDYESGERSSNPGYPELSDNSGRIPDYVAEFVVNNTRSLPTHYALYHFWVTFGGKFEEFFLSFKQSAAAQAAGKMMATCGRLAVDLESVRLNLCREYDIPAAPIEPLRGSSVENVSYR
jgi:hypothetical protein